MVKRSPKKNHWSAFQLDGGVQNISINFCSEYCSAFTIISSLLLSLPSFLLSSPSLSYCLSYSSSSFRRTPCTWFCRRRPRCRSRANDGGVLTFPSNKLRTPKKRTVKRTKIVMLGSKEGSKTIDLRRMASMIVEHLYGDILASSCVERWPYPLPLWNGLPLDTWVRIKRFWFWSSPHLEIKQLPHQTMIKPTPMQ